MWNNTIQQQAQINLCSALEKQMLEEIQDKVRIALLHSYIYGFIAGVVGCAVVAGVYYLVTKKVSV